MSDVDQEIEAHGSIQRGHAALAALKTYITTRESKNVNKLVATCNAGKLTESLMRESIARIAELRSLANDIDRDINVATAQVA